MSAIFVFSPFFGEVFEIWIEKNSWSKPIFAVGCLHGCRFHGGSLHGGRCCRWRGFGRLRRLDLSHTWLAGEDWWLTLRMFSFHLILVLGSIRWNETEVTFTVHSLLTVDNHWSPTAFPFWGCTLQLKIFGFCARLLSSSKICVCQSRSTTNRLLILLLLSLGKAM